HKRLVRALELAEAGSSLVPQDERLWSRTTRRPTLTVGLDVPPAVLEGRLRARAEAMFEQGVVAEVQAALAAGLSKTAAQALGLREIAELPRDQALEAIVQRSRRYAAYQRKWMRRIPDIVVLDADRPAELVARDVLRARAEHGQARERPPVLE
ncbi:MAG: tRNA dimethylallyltransferase, partial [Gaiella sp.]